MQRIVCLTGETVDILHRLGAGSSIVGVTAFTEHPAAAGLPVVSGYTSFKYDKIEALRPTLVLAYSSLQADAVAELSRRGLNVLITHQNTLASVFETIHLIAGVTGRTAEAAELIGQLQAKLNEASQAIPAHAHRPKVYFEEWNDPLVTGVTWISELIQAAGGADIFHARAQDADVKKRVVEAAEITARNPDIILASWCGKPVDPQAIRSRAGWQQIAAVQQHRIYEVPAEICLQPGPALIMQGLPELQRLIAAARPD